MAGDVREQSAARPQWRRDADVVVVGSGAAGISVALTAAAAGLRVLVVTKDLVGGATPLAQGGLAAALGADDTPAAHVADTLVAGAGLCEPDVVASLADAAPGTIGWLTGLGARLETRDLRLEGGHRTRRIVHSGDDATGAEVHRTLLAALLASGIEILDRTVALGLLAGGTDGAGTGTGRRGADGTAAANAGSPGTPAPGLVSARPASARDAADGGPGPAGEWLAAPGPGAGRPERSVAGVLAGAIGADGRLAPVVLSARAVVIAAGGLGQAFGTTSNPAGATGDGIAVAARAGAVIRDLEFVQFHPTVLWLPGASGQCPLITEALRGAGAVLRDLDGAPLMAGHDPRGDLAPRDVVAARMAEVIAAGGAGHVWLDATSLGRDLLEDGFPTVTAACRKHGIDPVTDLIPVAPGAHYSCGGILADLDGRTTLPGLYAAGEAASTGVQGANRLASNSVTEAVIAGRRTGTAIASALSGALSSALSGAGCSPGTGSGTYAATAPAGGAADRDRGSKRGTAPGTRGKRPLSPVSPPSFSGRSGDRGSSTANSAADGPRSRPGLPGAAAAPVAGAGFAARNRGKADRRELARAMSRYAGVMRDQDGLAELLRIISDGGGAFGTDARPHPVAGREGGREGRLEVEPASVLGRDGCDLDLEAAEAANLRTVSLLITAGALRRTESRGCHRRRDAAETAAAPWHTLARWDGQALVVTREEL